MNEVSIGDLKAILNEIISAIEDGDVDLDYIKKMVDDL